MPFRKVKKFAIYSKHPVILYKINEVKKMILQKAIKDTKKEFENIERKNEEDEVIEKYGSMFSPNKLDSLTKEDFKSFLLIKNNKHWEGIHRQGNMITQDMGKLKKALKILLNEELPIEDGTSGSGFTTSQNIKKNGFMIKSSIEIYKNVKL